MRRIVIALGSTASALVLLFSWPTSLNRSVPGGTVAAPTGTTAGAGSTASGSDGSSSSGSNGSGSSGSTSNGSGSSGSASNGSGSATGGSSGSGSASSDGSTSTAAAGTFTGAASQTRYGAVQVQITVADGQVTDAVAVDYPWRDRRDQEISSYAIPILQSETLSAQSASIQMVSGATYTSDGYIRSLQDALDQAGL